MRQSATLPPRAEIEHLVRQSLYRRLGRTPPSASAPPHPLVVNVSARHCHLTIEAVRALFGPDATLTPMKPLYQDGQYAAAQTVTLIGPRSRVISNLRVLGPCRDINQVELAATDAIALGFQLPTRQSGDIAGTPGCMLMGPHGFFEMTHGVIRAARHVHMHPSDAAHYRVKHGDFLRLRVGGPSATVFDQLLVRVHDDFKLEVHIDTDEGNACALQPDTHVQLTR